MRVQCGEVREAYFPFIFLSTIFCFLCTEPPLKYISQITNTNRCDLELMMNSGTSAYKCSKSKCQFYLHDLCFELPRQIKHKSHPQHPLTLISNPPYEYGEFKCDASFEYGSNCFAYHCVHCKYDLPLQCAALPETLGHPHHHEHTLTLRYSSLPPNHDQGKRIMCDLCGGSSPEGCWVYCCKDCGYTSDLQCSINAEADDQDYHQHDDHSISS